MPGDNFATPNSNVAMTHEDGTPTRALTRALNAIELLQTQVSQMKSQITSLEARVYALEHP